MYAEKTTKQWTVPVATIASERATPSRKAGARHTRTEEAKGDGLREKATMGLTAKEKAKERGKDMTAATRKGNGQAQGIAEAKGKAVAKAAAKAEAKERATDGSATSRAWISLAQETAPGKVTANGHTCRNASTARNVCKGITAAIRTIGTICWAHGTLNKDLCSRKANHEKKVKEVWRVAPQEERQQTEDSNRREAELLPSRACSAEKRLSSKDSTSMTNTNKSARCARRRWRWSKWSGNPR